VIGIENNKVYITPNIPEDFCAHQITGAKLSVFLKKTTNKINNFDNIHVEFIQEKHDPKSEVLCITGQTPYATVSLKFLFGSNSPKIVVNTITKYKKQAKVFNESLLLNFKDEVVEVFRKNRQIDTNDFQSEYWLDKQGVKFGSGDRTALIYHTPCVSSLQLRTYKKQIVVNLDDMHDHRYRRDSFGYTYNKVEQRAFHEFNASDYAKDQKRENEFSLFVGMAIENVPRLMINPYGFLASHVWTEHADKTSLKSHRAAYYGHEDIVDPSESVGGFVKYNIPVTKSVFYDNVHNHLFTEFLRKEIATNEDQDDYEQPSIKKNQRFVEFLRALENYGCEICLHGIGPLGIDEKPELIEEAFEFMKENFDSITWIDHARNFTNISTNGLQASSPHYAHLLWEKHGIKYFWHYSTEDIASVLNGNIDILQMGDKDYMRTPVYWLHPTKTYNFYSWATIAINDLSVYNKKSLSDLIEHWGICINHVYPGWIYENLSDNSFIERNHEEKLISKKNFDKLLDMMSDIRAKGDLNITTIRELLSYWISLENVEFIYWEDGSINIINNNKFDIKGISFAVNGDYDICVERKRIEKKKCGEQTIFWFNIEAQSIKKMVFNTYDNFKVLS